MRALDFWRNTSKDDFFGTNVDRIEKMLDEWANFPRRMPMAKEPTFYNPTCDLSETKSHYAMKFDLPGLTREQIKIDIQDNRLTVSGERKEEIRKEEEEEKDKKSYLSELFYGSFMRSFTFPTQVDSEKAEAKYESGVLTITVPKNGASRTRQVNVR